MADDLKRNSDSALVQSQEQALGTLRLLASMSSGEDVIAKLPDGWMELASHPIDSDEALILGTANSVKLQDIKESVDLTMKAFTLQLITSEEVKKTGEIIEEDYIHILLLADDGRVFSTWSMGVRRALAMIMLRFKAGFPPNGVLVRISHRDTGQPSPMVCLEYLGLPDDQPTKRNAL